MATEPPVKNEELSRALKELPELKQSSGSPKEFWPRLLHCLANLSLASKGVLLLKDSAQQPPVWKKFGEWSANVGPSRFMAAFADQLEVIGERCAREGHLIAPLEPSASRGSGHFCVAVRLKLPKLDVRPSRPRLPTDKQAPAITVENSALESRPRSPLRVAG